MSKTIPKDRHITYQRQFRKCGKVCSTCDSGGQHGPYIYAYWHVAGKMYSAYVGKAKLNTVQTRQEES